nr:MAG TPA: hypothetical protein [Caudoviricetes sp.]DAJ29547.1 MAG TPA: hypothetical protein [Caudoviricetes sp.]
MNTLRPLMEHKVQLLLDIQKRRQEVRVVSC